MPQVHCLPDDLPITLTQEDTVWLASLKYGIPHTSVCGGNARCSTCRVRILEGLSACQPRTPEEQQLAQKLGFPEEIRLACQLRVTGDVTLARMVIDDVDIDLVASQVDANAVGEEKHLAILFADIRGFTTRSEAMLPYDVIYLLNCYFDRVGKVITKYGGMINTYMGDGFMALFGTEAPLTSAQMAQHAVCAALDILTAVAGLNQRLDILRDQPLRVGIGIHLGQVVLGKIGAKNNQIITAIGDAVNFASRIEQINKTTGTEMLVSQTVWDLIAEQAVLGGEHRVSIPGKQGEYTLYVVLDMEPPADSPTVPAESTATWWQRVWQVLNQPL